MKYILLGMIFLAPAPVYKGKWFPTPVDGKWTMLWMGEEVWNVEFNQGNYTAERNGIKKSGTYSWKSHFKTNFPGKLMISETSHNYVEGWQWSWAACFEDDSLITTADSGGIYCRMSLKPK